MVSASSTSVGLEQRGEYGSVSRDTRKQSIGKRASERVRQHICQNEIRHLAKALKKLERVKGIEPSYSAWKAAALPLSYTRARSINYHAKPAASTIDAPSSR
jgi:hypothetical protein